MTLKDLSQLYYLNKEIKRDRRRLKELRVEQYKITSNNDGMPKGTKSIHDPIVEKIADVIDLEEILRLNMQKRFYEEKRIMNYINSIEDSFLRLIFKLRFIDCKSWYVIADEIGGGNTTDSVKKHCYRYLTKNKFCPKCHA